MQNSCRKDNASPLPAADPDPGVEAWRLVFQGLCRRYSVDYRDLQRAAAEQAEKSDGV